MCIYDCDIPEGTSSDYTEIITAGGKESLVTPSRSLWARLRAKLFVPCRKVSVTQTGLPLFMVSNIGAELASLPVASSYFVLFLFILEKSCF